MLGTEDGLSKFLIAHLDSLPEDGILQQPLPDGGRRLGVATLETPVLQLIRITEVAVAISEVVVPYGSGHQFATRTVLLLFLLVEIGTSLIAVGIQTEFGVDEIVDKRGHIDIAGIALLRVGEVGPLNHALHGVDIVLDIGHLLRLQTLFLGIDARPDDLTGHDAGTDSGHFRGEGGIIVVVGVDAENITASDVTTRDIRLL